MDKELRKLKNIDSKYAVKRIFGWLQTRDVPDYKKEAGMLFMMQEY